MIAVFEFEGEGIVCERVYFDAATILAQLTAGGPTIASGCDSPV